MLSLILYFYVKFGLLKLLQMVLLISYRSQNISGHDPTSALKTHSLTFISQIQLLARSTLVSSYSQLREDSAKYMIPSKLNT